MKTLQSLSQMAACLVALALVCLFSPTTQGAAKPGPEMGQVVVMEVNGVVAYSEAGQFVPLSKGKKLEAGTTIKTGPNSSVIIFLTNNRAQLTIDASTTLSVDKLISRQTGADTVSETEMEIKTGNITGNVKKLSRASTFNVKTPVGVAGIRGTAFLVQASGVIHVLQGTVVINYINAAGVSTPITINAGQTFTPPASPGGNPTVTVLNADTANTIAVQLSGMEKLVVQEGPIAIVEVKENPTIPPPDIPTTGGTGTTGG